MTRWRTYTDRLIVLALILAAWQAGSVLVGPYWLSSPSAVAARFVVQILNGELIVQGGYTIEEALLGTVIGGGAAGPPPAPLRAPSGNLPPPPPLHGRREWGPQTPAVPRLD